MNAEAVIGGRLQPAAATQSTYLVDHHPQFLEQPPLTNYATMPRQQQPQQPPNMTSTFSNSQHHSNTVGRRLPQHSTHSAHHYEEDERRRQAYIQSLGNNCNGFIMFKFLKFSKKKL